MPTSLRRSSMNSITMRINPRARALTSASASLPLCRSPLLRSSGSRRTDPIPLSRSRISLSHALRRGRSAFRDMCRGRASLRACLRGATAASATLSRQRGARAANSTAGRSTLTVRNGWTASPRTVSIRSSIRRGGAASTRCCRGITWITA